MPSQYFCLRLIGGKSPLQLICRRREKVAEKLVCGREITVDARSLSGIRSPTESWGDGNASNPHGPLSAQGPSISWPSNYQRPLAARSVAER